MDKQEEIWRPVKGYEGFYEVSNRGRVRSVGRWVTYADGRNYFLEGHILKPSRNKKTGYLLVALSRDDKRRLLYIHRLVAMAFIPNPENKPQVNHLDENPSNNDVYNLEWATAKENVNWGTAIKRRSKAVQAISPKTGAVVREFSSTAEAQRNGFSAGNISNCCRGKLIYHKGYRWRYKPTSTASSN